MRKIFLGLLFLFLFSYTNVLARYVDPKSGKEYAWYNKEVEKFNLFLKNILIVLIYLDPKKFHYYKRNLEPQIYSYL